MPNWWVFPARAPVRLYYHAEESGVRLLLRSSERIGHRLSGWNAVAGMSGAWTARLPDAPEETARLLPARLFRELRGRREDLAAPVIESRYRLLRCPRSARVVGKNEFGEEVREQDGRRWFLWPGMQPGGSWIGSERAHMPRRALRFRDRACYRHFAAGLAGQAARGQIRIDDDELHRLGAAVIDAGRRRGFRPWTDSPAESRTTLIEELRAAALRPARDSDRPLWTEAVTLERAVPALAASGGASPPLAVAAAAAAVAGPLREAGLVGAVDSGGWAGLFSGGANCVFDGRGLAAAEACAKLALASEQRAGRIVALIPADPESPELRSARQRIGQERGIEAALHLPPEAAGGEAICMLALGLPRPQRLAEAPPQAMRVTRATATGDIRRWLDEALRSRRRLAGEEDSVSRLAAYVPASRLGAARCMIPRGQQAAAAAAAQRVIDRHGPVDGFVSGLLEMSEDQLEQRFSPEQIDAVAMAESARRRSRAFLLADQTGTGKGRALAGAAGAWLNSGPDRRVLYLTKDAGVAMDVLRDIAAAGLSRAAGTVGLLGAGMASELRSRPDPEPPAQAPGDAERRRILDSRAWPEGSRFVISAYSCFQQAAADDAEKSASARRGAAWLLEASADPDVMLALDECHLAVNPDSVTGANIRQAVAAAGHVVFASATALRSLKGLDLYQRLLPSDISRSEFRHLRQTLEAGGETAQESFVSMLVEDGVMLRRDHDSGRVPYRVHTPEGAALQRNAAVMTALRPVAEALAAAREEVGAWVRQAFPDARRNRPPQDFQELGIDVARAALDTISVPGFGAPLDRIATAALTAMKIDQVVELAAAELGERERKPMISLSYTAGSWLEQIAAGVISLPAHRPPDLRDRLTAAAAGMFRVRRRGDAEPFDSRVSSERVAAAWRRVADAIEAMPAGLPASPVDAIIDGLRARGWSCREITGREWMMTPEGRVKRRDVPPKQTVARAFNDGECDVLIYNAAGGTGASYHASSLFADRRPRTILQLELPTDVLTHLQSMGRGNRFDQVALPEFVTVSTDTVPEQRLLAMTNRKLRTVGAILDGDRDHPALAPDIPDLFNAVGQDAAAAVLRAECGLAERLGLVRESEDAQERPLNTGALFTRAILLPEDEQRRLFALLTAEYQTRAAELDAAGSNPLRVPSLDGHMVIRESAPYATDGRSRQNADTVFGRPLTLSTGIWRRLPGLAAETVAAAALEARRRIAAGEDSQADPAWQSRRLSAHSGMLAESHVGDRTVLEDLARALAEAVPGAVWRDGAGPREMVIVDYIPPDADLAGYPHSHGFKIARPGEPHFQHVRGTDLINGGPAGTNILDAGSHGVLRRLDAYARAAVERPVQILSGDMLAVAGNMYGRTSGDYRIAQFVDQNGISHRAGVNSGDSLSLEMLPFTISAGSVLDVARSGAPDDDLHAGRHWPSARQETRESLARPEGSREYLLTLTPARRRLDINLPRLTLRMREQFWAVDTGPEIYRTIRRHELPCKTEPAGPPITAHCDFSDVEAARTAERVCALLDRHSGVALLAPGRLRPWWSRAGGDLHARRTVRWKPAAGLPAAAGLLREALAGDRVQPFLQLVWPGGDAEMDAVPDPHRPGMILSLPEFDREHCVFWRTGEGRALWNIVAGGAAMPDTPAPATGQRQCRFLPQNAAGAALEILLDKAAGTGGDIRINPAAAAVPERSAAAELAA